MVEVIGFILVALVALFGSLTQFYPGNVFIVAGVGVWAYVAGGASWWWFGAIAVIILASMVVKWVLPTRYMMREGVSNRTLLIGAIGGSARSGVSSDSFCVLRIPATTTSTDSGQYCNLGRSVSVSTALRSVLRSDQYRVQKRPKFFGRQRPTDSECRVLPTGKDRSRRQFLSLGSKKAPPPSGSAQLQQRRAVPR